MSDVLILATRDIVTLARGKILNFDCRMGSDFYAHPSQYVPTRIGGHYHENPVERISEIQVNFAGDFTRKQVINASIGSVLGMAEESGNLTRAQLLAVERALRDG